MRRSAIVAVGFLAAAPAMASDLPVRAVPAYKAPVMAPSCQWCGFYVGANAGYGAADPTAYVDPSVFLGMFPVIGGLPTVNQALSTASAPFSMSVQPKGWHGGLQAGYNWQSGAIVYGLEADVSLSGLKGDATRDYGFRVVWSVGDFDDFAGTVRLHQEIDYFGTLRGRLGYSGGSWLAYATGGLAWAHVKTSLDSHHVQLTNNINNFQGLGYPQAFDGHASSTAFQLGYAIGGGVEWAVAPKWSVKGEYLYVGLGHGPSLSIPGTTMTDTSIAMHLARIGVNYRLGGP